MNNESFVIHPFYNGPIGSGLDQSQRPEAERGTEAEQVSVSWCLECCGAWQYSKFAN